MTDAFVRAADAAAPEDGQEEVVERPLGDVGMAGPGQPPVMENLGRPEWLVDPAVARAKFEREIRAYRAQETEYRRRGWLLVRAEFPQVFALMAAPQLRPTSIQYGLLLDFGNYDLVAPSLKFVNPFTGEPLRVNQVQPLLQRRAAALNGNGQGVPGVADASPKAEGDAPSQPLAPTGTVQAPEFGNLVQGHPDHPAFLCVPGTREYHAHPFHSNDPWLAHRGRGPGTLYYLLDVVWRHGIVPLVGYQVQVNVSMVPQPDPTRIP